MMGGMGYARASPGRMTVNAEAAEPVRGKLDNADAAGPTGRMYKRPHELRRPPTDKHGRL